MNRIANPIQVATYYNRHPHQDAALNWLWENVPEEILVEFTRRWRTPFTVPLQTDPIAPRSVIGWERTTPAFRAKVGEIAHRLGIDPIWLAAIMSFETGGTFSPSIRNMAGSGATGLIQFMPETARGLGTSTEDLARMDALAQLDWVERYFRPYRGRMNSLQDAYMAVLWPAAVGRGPDAVLFRHPTVAYRQNAGLDWNRDGQITAREATRKVEERILS